MKTNRRQFLASAAGAAAAFTIVPRHVLGGPGFVPPSETINIALVGAGGRALQNLRELFKQDDCRVVAVADPVKHIDLSDFFYKSIAGREPMVETVEKHYRERTPGFKCAAYEDFREMYHREEKNFDAVLCSTTDHLHAAVSLPAMFAGKHIYCEKPLTHNIWESRLMAAAAKETGVATQMGNQGHSNEGIRKTVEWIRAGLIGPVREVHAWASTSRWNKTLAGKPEPAPVPSGVNWDLWLGPREERPYSPAYHPVAWRDFWDFGAGTLGDFGCHDLDAACWALDLERPTSVEARTAGYTDSYITPHGELVFYEFGPRGDLPVVKVTWYGGGLKPSTPKDWPQGEALPGRGVLFFGDEGTLFAAGAGGEPRLLGKAEDRRADLPEPTIPRSKGHYRDWLDACKGSEPASSRFEYGARLTELALLGVAAIRSGKRLERDGDEIAVPREIYQGTYRSGWEIV
jgi:predicted dehydrogenase